MIYFVRDIGSGLVKIGFSDKPWRRLCEIRTHCPGEASMWAIISGDRAEEARLHVLFAESRVRGEWFLPDGPISAFVEDAIASGATVPRTPPAATPEDATTPREMICAIGVSRLAEAAGARPETVRVWKTRNQIPRNAWPEVSAAFPHLTVNRLLEIERAA